MLSGRAVEDRLTCQSGRFNIWECRWARQDSNLGPTDYESAALTTELRARDGP